MPKRTVTKLYKGGHAPDGEMCIMEAVAYLAGEPWSDHPACVDPVLASFGRTLNDSVTEEQRQELLRFIPLLIGTAASPQTSQRRAFFLADAAVRKFAPAALRNAGLHQEADKLEALPPIVDKATALSAENAAESAARCARNAARRAEHAAWAAARSAENSVWSAALSARNAARSAARSARSAVGSAWYAIWSPVWSAWYAVWSAESAAESAARCRRSAALCARSAALSAVRSAVGSQTFQVLEDAIKIK